MSLGSNEFWFLKTNSALVTPNVIGLDTKAVAPMAMNIVSTTTYIFKRLSMTYIRVVGFNQITRIGALEESPSLLNVEKLCWGIDTK